MRKIILGISGGLGIIATAGYLGFKYYYSKRVQNKQVSISNQPQILSIKWFSTKERIRSILYYLGWNYLSNHNSIKILESAFSRATIKFNTRTKSKIWWKKFWKK